MKLELTKLTKKMSLLFSGFMVIALGIAISVQAKIGIGPWDVLHQGLANTLNISIGTISIIVGFIVLTLALLVKVYPGIGTILNIIFIGLFIDLFLLIVPESNDYFSSTIMLFVSIVLLALGSVLYIMAGLGAGPRDSLLLGLIQKFQIDTTFIRPVIEGVVIVIGFFLGGNFSIGTFVILFSLGYFMDLFFRIFKYDPKQQHQLNFAQQITYLKEVL